MRARRSDEGEEEEEEGSGADVPRLSPPGPKPNPEPAEEEKKEEEEEVDMGGGAGGLFGGGDDVSPTKCARPAAPQPRRMSDPYTPASFTPRRTGKLRPTGGRTWGAREGAGGGG